MWRWLVIVAACAAAFYPSLSNLLVQWDDQDMIINNTHIHAINLDNVVWWFTNGISGHYQPLALLTLAVDIQLWSSSPAVGIHLTNLVLHCGVSILLYVVLRRLTGLEIAALVAVLFFAVHPLRVEVVAWASERRLLLTALFLLAALYSYLGAHERCEGGAPWSWATLGFFALSLLCSSWGLTFPVILLLVDVGMQRRMPTLRHFAAKAPFVVLTLPSIIVTLGAQTDAVRWFEQNQSLSLVERVAVSFYGLVFYLHKTVLPLSLSPLYEIEANLRWWAAPYVISVVVTLLIAGGAFALRQRWPAVWICLGMYAVAVSPVLGLALQNGFQKAADRYTYLPCMALSALLALAITRVHEWGRLKPAGIKLFAALGTLALAGLIVLTNLQTRVWANTATLWEHALAVDPNGPVANTNVGVARDAAGAREEAMEYYRRALEAQPTNWLARRNLGIDYAAQGNLKAAIGEWTVLVDNDPADYEALFMIGAAHQQLGQTDEAADFYRRSIAANEEYERARAALDRLLTSNPE